MELNDYLTSAAAHLSSASPVLRTALVVQPGHNVSLSCNLTSSSQITWYLLRSDQLLPLLTVTFDTFGERPVNYHAAADRRRYIEEKGLGALMILQVEEEDAGLYFCSGTCAENVCVSRGIHLAVHGKVIYLCIFTLEDNRLSGFIGLSKTSVNELFSVLCLQELEGSLGTNIYFIRMYRRILETGDQDHKLVNFTYL
uniref:Ig-like domain-containing protein n=1 Tax=Labrus bergylta TaxID=56723 RepID=A0A3Q3GA97_9LABR